MSRRTIVVSSTGPIVQLTTFFQKERRRRVAWSSSLSSPEYTGWYNWNIQVRSDQSMQTRRSFFSSIPSEGVKGMFLSKMNSPEDVHEELGAVTGLKQVKQDEDELRVDQTEWSAWSEVDLEDEGWLRIWLRSTDMKSGRTKVLWVPVSLALEIREQEPLEGEFTGQEPQHPDSDVRDSFFFSWSPESMEPFFRMSLMKKDLFSLSSILYYNSGRTCFLF